tara:strand:- start:2459 stop:3466 length:1008 start_codon:yes stop_codon:yes gene_type:complete
MSYIIAEIGLNHDGSIKKCKKIINLAKKAGCDAVKLQSLSYDSTTSKEDLNKKIKLNSGRTVILSKYLQSIILDEKDHIELSKYCKKIKIDILSTPFDFKSIDFLKKYKFTGIKIASQDIIHHPLIIKASKQKLPIVISTGMSSIKEIKEAVSLIEKESNKKITILHCLSSYPSELKDLNLNRIKKLIELFPKYKIGFSDHTITNQAAIISASIGATVFEKHFTLNKRDEGFDHEMSYNFEEMKEYVKQIRLTELALGSKDYNKLLDSSSKKVMRRSIVASRDLAKGTKLKFEDFDYKRPPKGLEPSKYNKLIGKILVKNINKDKIIKLSDLKKI